MSNNNGPKFGSLRTLAGMLPKMGKMLRQKAGFDASVLSGSVTKPRKVCKICLKLFDIAATTPESLPEPSVCEEHQKLLDNGCAAFICDGMFAIAKSSRFAKGEFVIVNSDTMKAIEAEGIKVHKQHDDAQH